MGHSDVKEEMVNLNTGNSALKNTIEAWLKFGTVFLTYRFFVYYLDNNGTDKKFFDKQYVLMVFYLLLGFAIYYMLIDPVAPKPNIVPILNNVIEDTMLFGTVLVSSHVIESYMGGSNKYFNGNWLKNSALVLAAFAAYRIFIEPMVPRHKQSDLVNDWLQFGVFLVTYRVLSVGSIDQKFIYSVLLSLLGFGIYDAGVKKLITVK